MSRFNGSTARPSGRSPVQSGAAPSGTTHEGAPGFVRDAKSELYLLAVTNMVGQGTFYEGAGERDIRFENLVHDVAAADPAWMVGFLRWLRGPEANMRSASLVAAAEFVKARLALTGADDRPSENARGWCRQAIDAVLQRADEPGEFLGYWTSRYGRELPMPVKRGVADGVLRLYTPFSLLKYDTPSHAWRFGDVIELCHPDPATPEQDELFRYALDARHGREYPEGFPYQNLAMIELRAKLLAMPVADRRETLDFPQMLAEAGMTWESLAGWLQGPMDAAAWEAIIPSMGYMALLRNLRNFDQAGVSDAAASTVAAKLSDSSQVARSRQLPLRFLSAYRNAPSLRWAWPLECALDASLGNIPVLDGHTLILVDTSTSMCDRLSAKSDLTRQDAAALFAIALGRRCARAEVVSYSSAQHYYGDPTGARTQVFHAVPGESVLSGFQRWTAQGYMLGGGTDTRGAARKHFRSGVHTRVILLTDEQSHGWSGTGIGGDSVLVDIPREIPAYTWNLAGYEHGHAATGFRNRHTFGGLTDAGFRMIPLLEAGRTANWPWLSAAG